MRRQAAVTAAAAAPAAATACILVTRTAALSTRVVSERAISEHAGAPHGAPVLVHHPEFELGPGVRLDVPSGVALWSRGIACA